MFLTKPNQQLRRDLKAIASNLEEYCIDWVSSQKNSAMQTP